MQRVKINSADMENIWEKRWKARTDLLWLCKEVLNFDKIHPRVHGPVVRHLQQFPVPSREAARYYDRILSNGSFQYTSWCDPYIRLEGPRRRMLLDSRSYFKCLRPEEKVTLANGTYVEAQRVTAGMKLKSLDEQFGATTCEVIGTEIQASQPCYQITFTSGRVLKVSEEHPFRKVEGWVEAKALQAKDRIAIINEHLSWDTVKSVEPLGDLETIAIETSDGVLVVDDVVTHNTSINTLAHTIQWLLNFPHMAIALMFSTDSKAQDILKNGIKYHFQYNKRLRELFPEYCPQKAIAQWGSAESFTLPNRNEILDRLSMPPRVEESVMSQSLGKGQAGYHFDLIKGSDVVENTNIATPMQRQEVKKGFGIMTKLLVKRPDGLDGFIDLEGTFYHPDDLHCAMVNEWYSLEPDKRVWSVFLRGVFQRNVSEAACKAIDIDPTNRPRHDPDELKLPFLLDANGKRVPTWPEADPIEKLEAEETSLLEGGQVFAYQRVLDVLSDTSSMRPFKNPITWVKREDFQRVPVAYHLTMVDFATSENTSLNPSVILTAAFDRHGRAYVHDIQRGWWGPDETLEKIFEVNGLFKPEKIVIEDGLFEKGLRPSIKRLEIEKSTWPPWHFQTRDRTTRKIQKIIAALQTPYNSGELKFVDPIVREDEKRSKEVETALRNELQDCTMASTGKTDDILDCLADLYLCREWFGAEGIRGGALPEAAAIQRLQQEQFQAAFRKAVFPDDPAFAPPSTRTGW